VRKMWNNKANIIFQLFSQFFIFMIMGGCLLSKVDPIPFPQTTQGMVLIPEGYFWMGSTEKDGLIGIDVGVDEIPKQKIFLPSFYLDQFEVTNRAYKIFVDVTQRGNKIPGYWVKGSYPLGSGDEPVSDTDWFDAYAYCDWTGKRLPSEREWEKAARGNDGRIWPWGNQIQDGAANTANEGWEWKRPIGSYDLDTSPFGVYDMAGNVREWTSSWYEAYPGSRLKRNAFGKSFRVIKGGSYADSGAMTRLAHRIAVRATHDPDGDRTWHTDYANGFRCAKDIEEK